MAMRRLPRKRASREGEARTETSYLWTHAAASRSIMSTVMGHRFPSAESSCLWRSQVKTALEARVQRRLPRLLFPACSPANKAQRREPSTKELAHSNHWSLGCYDMLRLCLAPTTRGSSLTTTRQRQRAAAHLGAAARAARVFAKLAARKAAMVNRVVNCICRNKKVL